MDAAVAIDAQTPGVDGASVDGDPTDAGDAASHVDASVVATDAARDASSVVGDAAANGEATWSHTACDKTQLPYPRIDGNNGVFPLGSCPPPANLARACAGGSRIRVVRATASASQSATHPPQYAVDEHIMTRWASPTMANAWLALDLGAQRNVQRIYLAWELAHASDYDVQASNDGTSWLTLKQVRGGNGYQDIIDLEVRARYIRINGLTRGLTGTGGQMWGYSLFDVVLCEQRP